MSLGKDNKSKQKFTGKVPSTRDKIISKIDEIREDFQLDLAKRLGADRVIIKERFESSVSATYLLLIRYPDGHSVSGILKVISKNAPSQTRMSFEKEVKLLNWLARSHPEQEFPKLLISEPVELEERSGNLMYSVQEFRGGSLASNDLSFLRKLSYMPFLAVQLDFLASQDVYPSDIKLANATYEAHRATWVDLGSYSSPNEPELTGVSYNVPSHEMNKAYNMLFVYYRHDGGDSEVYKEQVKVYFRELKIYGIRSFAAQLVQLLIKKSPFLNIRLIREIRNPIEQDMAISALLGKGEVYVKGSSVYELIDDNYLEGEVRAHPDYRGDFPFDNESLANLKEWMQHYLVNINPDNFSFEQMNSEFAAIAKEVLNINKA